MNTWTRVIKDAYHLNYLLISDNSCSYCQTKQLYRQLPNFRPLHCKNYQPVMYGTKNTMLYKYSTFKTRGKQMLLKEVVPPLGSHFWGELAFISINFLWWPLNWIRKLIWIKTNLDKKNKVSAWILRIISFSPGWGTSASWRAPAYLLEKKKISNFDSEIKVNYLNLL